MPETSIVGATVANPCSVAAVRPLAGDWAPGAQWPMEMRAQQARALDPERPPHNRSAEPRRWRKGATLLIPTLNITRSGLIGHPEPHARVAQPRKGSHGSLSRRLGQGGADRVPWQGRDEETKHRDVSPLTPCHLMSLLALRSAQPEAA